VSDPPCPKTYKGDAGHSSGREQELSINRIAGNTGKNHLPFSIILSQNDMLFSKSI
jgi:hypothetical protein